MKSSETIESNCPECGNRTLILREKDVYCNHCQKAVLHEIPRTPEGKREVTKALANYLRKS